MTDDQIQNRSTGTVSSPKSLGVVHGQPNYQSELDVFEAMARLEEKFGKKILTEKQREKMDNVRKHLRREDGGGRDDSEKAAEIFMYTLKKFVEKAIIGGYQYCSFDEWKLKNAENKRILMKMFFYMTFGVKEEEMKKRLIAKFGGDAAYAT